MVYRRGYQQDKIKVLFAAANPALTRRLKLDEEIREITDKIERAKHRDLLELMSIWAVRPDDLLQSLNKHKPQIVHFSAHGNPTGEIVLVDDGGLSRPMSPQDIKVLFTILKDNIRIVILNACYSQQQARAIVQVVDCAIGMNSAIEGRAAVAFAASFYRAIAFGRSVQEAFDQGKLALRWTKIPEEHVPELHVKVGVDPSKIFLVMPEEDLVLQEGKIFLMRGRDDLLCKDHVSATRNLEKAIEILNETDTPQVIARAKYFLALAQLKGKRPFIQTKSLMDSIENLLHSAITLHRTYTYIFTLALFKIDLARHGLTYLMHEAQQMHHEAIQITHTTEDEENIKLLIACQPDLLRDYVNLLS